MSIFSIFKKQKLAQKVCYRFYPLDDMTLQEVIRLLRYHGGYGRLTVHQHTYDVMPENVKRHFKKEYE
jgi:hypothetical protein